MGPRKTNTRATSSIQYVPGLDGVRAIAIALVVLFHFTSGFAPALAQLGDFWRLFSRAANVGWIGVDIFFVVSGFLITKVIAAKPIESIAQFGHFIARRAWRLLPAYAFCLITFAAIAATVDPYGKVFGNQALLWTLTSNIESSFGDRSALQDANFSLVHFWSLALEWHFYLLFPIMIAALRSPTRAVLILIGMSVACRIVFYAEGLSDNATYSFTFCRMDSLAIGALLALRSGRISCNTSTIVALAGMVMFAGLVLCLADSGWKFKHLPWLQTIGYTAIAISVAMMLLGVVNAPRDSKVIQALELPWLTFIGRSSYSLYVWHLVFFPAIVRVVGLLADGVAERFLFSFAIGLSVTAATGTASYLWIETRFVRAKPLTLDTHNLNIGSQPEPEA
jgi:peptidoglycan/LPS O-acetylase OafA/YrhL